MVELLDPVKDIDSFKFVLDFLQESLKKPKPNPDSSTNSEKWVRNQAM